MAGINTKIITRTALMLALTIVFQSLGRFIPLGANSNFVVGPLVNASLLISTYFIGIFGGAFIAVLSPFGAILTGATIPLLFAPFIAVGNLALVLFFYFLWKKNFVVGVITGSIIKFITLYAAVLLFTNLAGIPAKKATVLIATFSWPQLVTALAGGLIAFIVTKLVKTPAV